MYNRICWISASTLHHFIHYLHLYLLSSESSSHHISIVLEFTRFFIVTTIVNNSICLAFGPAMNDLEVPKVVQIDSITIQKTSARQVYQPH